MERDTGGFYGNASAVDIKRYDGFFRRLLAFAGPAYLISAGYMDPGNWATDIAGGSRFGYSLIWVVFMSNLAAILMQSLSTRLGIVTGKDLAQACRAHYGKAPGIMLWILAETAVVATDLAEVLGSAIGLQLLFHIPLFAGVLLTTLDTLLILLLNNFGVRKLEALVVGLVSIIGLSFMAEVVISKPDIHGIAAGFIPQLPGNGALFIAIGIIGATVMPHNLYLHSSLVQSRSIEKSDRGIKQAIRFNMLDSVFALNVAFFVNTAILVTAAAVFYRNGEFGINGIAQAYRMLEPLLGSSLAPLIFAVALIASGQSSTITGTLAGQIVMEGFMSVRVRPWVMRLATRLLAIAPALIVISLSGESSAGMLLVLSQVVLSLQLSFAVVPLVRFVSDRSLMGRFAAPAWLKALSWSASLIIISLNVILVSDSFAGWPAGGNPAVLALGIPIAAVLGAFLAYLLLESFISGISAARSGLRTGAKNIHGDGIMPVISTVKPFSRIALALDFSVKDRQVLSYGVSMARGGSALILLHVVESVGARVLGKNIGDSETREDTELIERYAEELRGLGISEIVTDIGYGNPASALAGLIKKHEADIAIFGSHGHRGITDMIFGTTTDKVKHLTGIPIFIAR